MCYEKHDHKNLAQGYSHEADMEGANKEIFTGI